jgi:phenol 2-monooxygenase (NADPH)
VERPGGLPEEVDLLIIGCGPAGLVLAAQMGSFPDIRTVIVDRKDGPLEVGQADGVGCRTVEMFEAFGLADRLVREAYWVKRGVLLAAGPGRPDPDQAHGADQGHRRGPVGVPARDRQPGANASPTFGIT